MTFVRAKPTGWSLAELLTSSEMNVIDSQIPFALDGRDGGSYAPVDTLLLDGFNLENAKPTVLLRNTPTDPALAVELQHGGEGIYVTAPGAANTTLIDARGGTLTINPSSLATSTIRAVGHAINTGFRGGAAFHGTGGTSLSSGKKGGPGLLVEGGPATGTTLPKLGGDGVIASSGTSDLHNQPADERGASAVYATGGSTIGSLASHRGGLGVYGRGSVLTGTGRGGSGVYGTGGNGPSDDDTSVDVGQGVVGKGSIGILGANNFLDPLTLPSEFADFNARAGVKAVAKSYGRAFISEFSGPGTEDEFNVIRWVGVGGGQDTKVLLQVESAIGSAGPTGTSHTYGIKSSSFDSNSGNFVGARLHGRGRPCVELVTDTASEYQPALKIPAQNAPSNTSYINGGIYWHSHVGSPITGLLDSTLYIGSSTSRKIYDRVVTSGDRSAAQAWGKITTNGSGGSAVTGYGVASVVITASELTVTLHTIPGQSPAANLIVVSSLATASGYGRIIWTVVLSSTMIQFNVQTTGNTPTVINPLTNTLEIHFAIYGAPSGAVADRPTYYLLP